MMMMVVVLAVMLKRVMMVVMLMMPTMFKLPLPPSAVDPLSSALSLHIRPIISIVIIRPELMVKAITIIIDLGDHYDRFQQGGDDGDGGNHDDVEAEGEMK